MKSLAQRRHHYYRLKRKRLSKNYRGIKDTRYTKNPENLLGVCINTPKACSCLACGNPRKHFHAKTKKEKISDIDFKLQKAEQTGFEPRPNQ